MTCVWLLPFYDSPLRDGGYDIADYRVVNRRYGTLEDCRRFVAAAHERGIKVITELVINHTSDEHQWFQAARRAPAGSAERDFYVWSETADRYPDARVIFHHAETSNWTWDPEARAFYWHRFFSHQPDLNFDNPRVQDAVLDVMRFWLDLGVDGLRLDAIPHLFEREGTTCDNLPETHAFIKRLRAAIDEAYEDRILIAEANQPLDVIRSYFGDGDECQMAFHFPLVHRLFLALARQDARPIVEVVTAASNLPAGAQWATFLRNHDELSFSSVEDPDLEQLLDEYGPEPGMRLISGVRRRLSPLLGRNLARVELAFALLFSLPGSPVIYYGDELGMGDDIGLPDRDGLRLPMRWQDVERQELRPVLDIADRGDGAESLLSVIKRMIATRRQHPAFGRGSVAFIDAGNPRILALTRQHEHEEILVLANLGIDDSVSRHRDARHRGGSRSLRMDVALQGSLNLEVRTTKDTAPSRGARSQLRRDGRGRLRWSRPGPTHSVTGRWASRFRAATSFSAIQNAWVTRVGACREWPAMDEPDSRRVTDRVRATASFPAQDADAGAGLSRPVARSL